MPRWKTFMSPVCYRVPAEGAHPVDAADTCTVVRRLPSVDSNDPGQLYWLDEMLNGGLEIPASVSDADGGRASPPFLLLLAGPPGAGKSSFALELCYNLGRHPQTSAGVDYLNSLYISTEHPARRVIENTQSFGWHLGGGQNSADVFAEYKTFVRDGGQALDHGVCVVMGLEAPSDPPAGPLRMPSPPPAPATTVASAGAARDFIAFVERYWNTVLITRRLPEAQKTLEQFGATGEVAVRPTGTRTHGTAPPDVVVIDSLNVFRGQQESGRDQVSAQLDRVREMFTKAGHQPKLLILIVDGTAGSEKNSAWEYLADAVFRFDWDIGPEGYFQRTFHIVKVKTQSHALGQHGLKIVPREAERNCQGRTRSTPYMEAGGTFIFPTVHWHISRSVRDVARGVLTADDRADYPTPLDRLNDLLGAGTDQPGGFPAGRTTALIGQRGGMKSHLAYHFLLTHLLGLHPHDPATKHAILISLRDDIDATRRILATIALERSLLDLTVHREAVEVVQQLLDRDRLEIIYNWPGCVSPGEFFHRIYVALRRRRSANTFTCRGKEVARPTPASAEIVVLNGLDHLEAQFPLCASERTFIPALLSLFRANGVCTVIISTDEGPGTASYEIGPMADLILDFSVAKQRDLDQVPAASELLQRSKVTVVRIPAGRIGGQWGIFGRQQGGIAFLTPPPQTISE